jgi:sugar phosphate isomerase/epimerase
VPSLHRRRFLTTLCAGAAGLTIAEHISARSEPAYPFPTAPRDRLAVTSYPFRAWIESPTNHGRDPKLPAMDLTEFPSFAAKQFNIHNINPLADHFHSTDQNYIDRFRAALEAANSHIVDLGLSGGEFYSTDASRRQAGIDLGKRGIDLAAGVGSPSVRQHIHGQGRPDIALAAESLARLADYGGQHKVVVNLENDSLVSEDPFFLAAVIDKVNHPYLRGLPDFGNSLVQHDQAFNLRAVRAMLQHAFNMCHIKDSVTDDKGKLYRVDLAPLFQEAKRSGYRGFFSMEFDTNSGDPIAGTRNLIQQTLSNLT